MTNCCCFILNWGGGGGAEDSHQRCEFVGGGGVLDVLPQKILKSRGSEMVFSTY